MKKVRLSLDLPEETDARLRQMADDLGISKTELIRRSLLLTDLAHSARKENKFIGIIGPDNKLETRLLGI